MTPDARKIASVMGGDAHGNQVNFPTIGHGPKDRGTSVTVDPAAPDGIVLHCHNGGDWRAERDRLRDKGLIAKFEPRKPTGHLRIGGRPAAPRVANDAPVTAWEYCDGDGVVVARKVRHDRPNGKSYSWQTPDGAGGWRSGRGADPVPYRLPELLTADHSELIVMAEGEKCADVVAGLGFLATSSRDLPKPLPTLFKGRTVTILPDEGEAGRGYAEKAAKAVVEAGGTAHVLDPFPGVPPGGDVVDWTDAGGTADELAALIGAAVSPPIPAIVATPFSWPDPRTIPPRPWLFGRWLLRGELTAIVAPGGIGKSTFTTAMALSLASGRELLEKTVWEGARTVWLWNLEDANVELGRQVSAVALHYGIAPQHCSDRLYVDSGVDTRLCTATEGPDGVRIADPVFDALKAEIERRGVDVLIVDPFVATHEVDENANGMIEAVAARWKRLAHETSASIVLVHHTKKMHGRAVTAEDSRGAVSLTNKARSTLVLNAMTQDEAEKWGIDPAERRAFVRVDDDKPNRAPAEKAWWMRKESVALENIDKFGRTDEIGAAVPWSPPNPLEGLSTDDLYRVQLAIGEGEWGDNVQAGDWAGHAVASVIGADLDDAADQGRVKSLLRTWKQNGALKVEHRKVRNGNNRPFLVVGRRVDPGSFPTSVGVVVKGGEGGEEDHSEHLPTTTPLGVGGGGGGERDEPAQGGGE